MKYYSKQKEKDAHLKISPVPEYITCPKCGGDIELWSDEDRTICFFCGHKVFSKETTIH